MAVILIHEAEWLITRSKAVKLFKQMNHGPEFFPRHCGKADPLIRTSRSENNKNELIDYSSKLFF